MSKLLFVLVFLLSTTFTSNSQANSCSQVSYSELENELLINGRELQLVFLNMLDITISVSKQVRGKNIAKEKKFLKQANLATKKVITKVKNLTNSIANYINIDEYSNESQSHYLYAGDCQSLQNTCYLFDLSLLNNSLIANLQLISTLNLKAVKILNGIIDKFMRPSEAEELKAQLASHIEITAGLKKDILDSINAAPSGVYACEL